MPENVSEGFQQQQKIKTKRGSSKVPEQPNQKDTSILTLL